jgi:hypothetical protein
MKKLLLLSAISLLLVGCASKEQSLADELLNPLFAVQYGDALAENLANLIINKDPLVEEKGIEEKIQKEIASAKVISRVGKERQNSGMWGNFVSEDDMVSGLALSLENTLYVSPDFDLRPLPQTHIYLTTVVDPRDVTFPDTSALDLGPIHSSFGAQTYAITGQNDASTFRTAVLFDPGFKKILGFAQLSKKE